MDLYIGEVVNRPTTVNLRAVSVSMVELTKYKSDLYTTLKLKVKASSSIVCFGGVHLATLCLGITLEQVQLNYTYLRHFHSSHCSQAISQLSNSYHGICEQAPTFNLHYVV